MKEIQGGSILVVVSERLELTMVRVSGSQLKVVFYNLGHQKRSSWLEMANNYIKQFSRLNQNGSYQLQSVFLLQQKFLQQQDQDLMKQFAKLRGVLNSIKDRPEDPPQFDRQISLPEDSPWSPMFLDYSITEDSPTTFHRDEVSPGLRRRAYSDFAGTVPHYPLSKLVYDDGFGSEERFENFLIWRNEKK